MRQIDTEHMENTKLTLYNSEIDMQENYGQLKRCECQCQSYLITIFFLLISLLFFIFALKMINATTIFLAMQGIL